MSDLAGLVKEYEIEEIVVKFCGVKLAHFNLISNDYAHTHADDWMKLFAKAWWNNPRMAMDKRVEVSAAYAHANLSDEETFRKSIE